MRFRIPAAVAAVSIAALMAGGLGSAFASPDGEHGHGFNCTPGNPGNAEAQHEEHGKDDHGNGDDCLQAATVAPTTTTTTTLAPAAQPTTAAVQPRAAAVQPAAAQVVTAQPRTAG
jgi:hypothetical protein